MTATTLRRSLATVADRHPVASFSALALALSWGTWVPALFALPESPARALAVVPGAFGPGVAAAVVTRLRGDSVRDWLADTFAWRRRPRWYLVALGLPLAVSACFGAALMVHAGRFDAAALRASAIAYPAALVFATLLGGGQEEVGWRGFALPHLQRRYDALTASVAVGAVWALWHAPLFAFDVPGYAGVSPPLYAAAVVAFAVVFTWYYNGSRGCLPGAMLLHGSINAAVNLPVPAVGGLDAISVPFAGVLAVAFWMVALALVALYGRETLAAAPKVGPTRADSGSDAPSGPTATAPEVSET